MTSRKKKMFKGSESESSSSASSSGASGAADPRRLDNPHHPPPPPPVKSNFLCKESEEEEDEEISEVDSFLLDDQEAETEVSAEDSEEDEDEEDYEEDEDDEEASSQCEEEDVVVATGSSNPPSSSSAVDPETQQRLEALLEAAGIGTLGETKQLRDKEVIERLQSSVSCALDEAAAALTRMRSDPPPDGRSLVDACNEGDIGKVRKLLDEGRVSVNDPTEQGESLLSLACSAGYFELAQVLLAMGANVEDRGIKNECTPLMEAASAGHVDIVTRLLLAHGADVNAQSSSGNTPLMYACAGGHEDVVLALLKAQANVEDHNENGHTPLMEAASAGHVNVAKILLKYGAGINTHSNEFKESALTLACYKGHLEMVRFLLEAGADQEHKTDEMHTALMEASMDGHVEVARLLLDSGAQVNMPADSFESPLTLAACGGHVELAMLLLERGANIEEVNDEGYTPLMEASREGHEEMVALLLSQGADINAQTEETQETALTLACCGGFLDVADFLIKAGADIELGASTPLMEAAQEGHLELVRHLLENGAEVNAQTGTCDTALTYACENGHTDVADLLLKYKAELEHLSEGGRTPLMKAARAGHLCTVQFLISKGAEINRPTTNKDHTPLSLACAGGHQPVVQLLLESGADPYHKLKDNSTMLIEAAKGGHTNVVQLLIDYPNSIVMPHDSSAAAVVAPPIERVPPPCGTDAIISSSSKSPSLKSVLRKSQRTTSNTKSNTVGTITSVIEHKSSVAGGYDFLEGSDLVLEGLEDKGLDAKSYIQSMLRRTEGSTREQSIQRDHIMAELHRVEKELQEKAQTQMMLSNREACDGSDAGSDVIPATEILQNMANLSIAAEMMPSSDVVPPPLSSSGPLSQRALANLPPSERPKAKPSRKNDNKSGKKSQQIHPAVMQHSQQLAQLQHLKQINHSLQQEVLQQKQAKKQNQATLANLQQNAIQNQRQLTTLQANVEHIQQMEQQLLNQPAQSQQQQLQQKIQHVLQEKYQLQQHIKHFQQEVEQQLAYTQHATPPPPPPPPPTTTNKEDENNELLPSNNAYELVHSRDAIQAVQAVPLLDQPPSSSNVPMPLAAVAAAAAAAVVSEENGRNQPAIIAAAASTLQVAATSAAGTSAVHQIPFPSNDQQQQTTQQQQPVSAFGHQLLLQTPQILDGQINFASGGADLTTAFPPVGYDLPSVVDVGVQPPPSNDSSKKVSSKGNNKKNKPLFQNHDLEKQAEMFVQGYQLGVKHQLAQEVATDGTTTTFNQQFPGGVPPTSAGGGNGMPYDLDSATESNHDTALTLACAGGHEELVQLLLSRGADIEHRDKKGFTPLILAATAGHEKVVEILLDHTVPAEIEAQSERTKDTPLSLACSGGRIEVVEILLSRHANKEHRNVSDYTPLSLAASGGYVNIIKLLLAHGAEINSRTGSKLGISPLMLAAMNGHTAAVRLLLDMGSDINAQIETNRNTALTLACFQGRHEVVSLLLDRKAAVEHRAKTGLTPLMEAASGGYVEVGRVLLNKGADVNAPPVPSSRDTALTIAADKGHYRFVELLLNRKAQVDVRNKKGNSSLWLAANGGHLDVVQLLYSSGADIDSQDNRKVSCLMAAFRKGHSKVVKWMVKHVSQFPSDQELTRFIATINDKDLSKKCQQCMEIIRVAKDRQAAEAAKNATILLEELDRESKMEQSKKEAAARKREKKKRKKMEKMGKTQGEEEEDKENSDSSPHDINTEDEKEKSPEIIVPVNEAGDSGIDANSQGSSQENQEIMKSKTNNNNNNNNNEGKKNKKNKKKNNKMEEQTPPPQPPPPITTPKQPEITTEKKEVRVPSTPDSHQVVNGNNNTSDKVVESSSGRINNKNRNRRMATSTAAASSSSDSYPSPTAAVVTSDKTSPGHKKVVSPSTTTAKAPTIPPPDAGWKEVVRKSKKVSVPANAISRVIGRGGSNINAIRELSGAHIEVEKQTGKNGADRTILIKGSAESTRQANSWIQAIINCPEKDLSEIIGKQFKNLSSNLLQLQAASSVSATSVSTSSVSPNISRPASTTKGLGSKIVTTAKSVTSSPGGGKKVTSSIAPPPLKSGNKSSSSFAAVAQGRTDIVAPSPQPNNNNNNFGNMKKAEEPPTRSYSPFKSVISTELNDQNKDFSPYKPFMNWNPMETNSGKETFMMANNTGLNDINKAPGYRANATATPQPPQPPQPPTWNNEMFDSVPQERCNSAPGTPISPSIPTPIGPPPSSNNPPPTPTPPNNNSTKLSPSSTSSGGGGVGGRSLTPDLSVNESDIRQQRSASLVGLATAQDPHQIPKREFLKTTGLQENNLLNAARLAVGGGSSTGFDFNTNHSVPNSDFSPNNRNSYQQQQQQQRFNSIYNNPGSKLNPNAPDFTRGGLNDYLRGPPPPPPPSIRQNASRYGLNQNLTNILSNQSINSVLHSMNNYPNTSSSATAAPPPPPPPPAAAGGAAFDPASLCGRSIMEITEMLKPSDGFGNATRSPFQAQSSGPPPVGDIGGFTSRPIGSERLNRVPSKSPWDLPTNLYDSLAPPHPPGRVPATDNNGFNFPPSMTTFRDTFDTLNKGSGTGDSVFNGGPTGSGYMSGLHSPASFASPNVTPNKSDFNDFPPGSGSKKLAGFERGDPNAVRRNMNQMWPKHWED